jgi:hypothetical protein
MSENYSDVLEQIRAVKHRLICSQVFRGYSGMARICGGFVALIAGLSIASSSSRQIETHIIAWGGVCGVAFSLNLGAVFWWKFKEQQKLSNFETLVPVIDVIAPLFVGAIGTFALIQSGMYDLLFGFWMCLYGLVHTASRHTCSRGIFYLGWYYIICGTFFLTVSPLPSFFNPWPMAIVFFVGEIIGGFLFLKNRGDLANE